MKKKTVPLNTPIPFETIKDKFIKGLVGEKSNDTFVIKTKDGQEYKLYHQQDCCERVYIEDICGSNLKDLIGHRIIAAEEINNVDKEPLGSDPSYTWTFYRLITEGGTIVIRWYGVSSHGNRDSEKVDFVRVR